MSKVSTQMNNTGRLYQKGEAAGPEVRVLASRTWRVPLGQQVHVTGASLGSGRRPQWLKNRTNPDPASSHPQALNTKASTGLEHPVSPTTGSSPYHHSLHAHKQSDLHTLVCRSTKQGQATSSNHPRGLTCDKYNIEVYMSGYCP